MLPIVSVLTPTYNRPELLRRAIQIFLSYRYARKEMIIVDDSPRRAEIPNSPSINYIWLEDRRILGEKHNIAAEAAQGDIFLHQDDDDLFAPERLTKQVEPIVLNKADVTGIKMHFIREETTGRFFVWANGAKFTISDETTKPLYEFHDSNSAFHRRVWDSGIQYTVEPVTQKLHLLNAAMRAGFRFWTLENAGTFVYSRHSMNTWHFSRNLLVEVKAPSLSRAGWFQKLLGRAA